MVGGIISLSTIVGRKMTLKSYKEVIDIIPSGYLKHSCLGPDDEIFKVLDGFNNLSGVCIEIGTYKGIGASILAQYFDLVYTFDIKHSPETEFIWRQLEVKKKVIYKVCSSREEILQYLKRIGKVFRFGFIDAYHDYNNVKADFLMLRSVGIPRILFHDATNPGIKIFLQEVGAKILSKNLAMWGEKNGEADSQ